MTRACWAALEDAGDLGADQRRRGQQRHCLTLQVTCTRLPWLGEGGKDRRHFADVAGIDVAVTGLGDLRRR